MSNVLQIVKESMESMELEQTTMWNVCSLWSQDNYSPSPYQTNCILRNIGYRSIKRMGYEHFVYELRETALESLNYSDLSLVVNLMKWLFAFGGDPLSYLHRIAFACKAGSIDPEDLIETFYPIVSYKELRTFIKRHVSRPFDVFRGGSYWNTFQYYAPDLAPAHNAELLGVLERKKETHELLHIEVLRSDEEYLYLADSKIWYDYILRKTQYHIGFPYIWKRCQPQVCSRMTKWLLLNEEQLGDDLIYITSGDPVLCVDDPEVPVIYRENNILCCAEINEIEGLQLSKSNKYGLLRNESLDKCEFRIKLRDIIMPVS